MIEVSIVSILCGFILDLILGDPYWLPHPVRLIGWLIVQSEKGIRKILPKHKKGERIGGILLVVVVVGVTMLSTLLILKGAYSLHPTLGFIIEVIMCYQILATRCLADEGMKVYKKLVAQDLEGARKQVSMIVGRDTEQLTEEGVAKATIETIGENTSDGIVGPLCFLVLGGPVLGFMYKAINTMDSMVGYRNDKYLYFGRCAAKLDDVVNFIPSRLSALFMIVASFICRLDSKKAWEIYKRDRYNHKSPNSAHTEAVCAGALGIQLAGDAYYFGELCKKPSIGDARRSVEHKDIIRTNLLMYVTCVISLIVLVSIRLVVIR